MAVAFAREGASVAVNDIAVDGIQATLGLIDEAAR